MKTSCQGDKDLVLLALVSLSDGLGSYRSLAITEALSVSLSLSLSLSLLGGRFQQHLEGARLTILFGKQQITVSLLSFIFILFFFFYLFFLLRLAHSLYSYLIQETVDDQSLSLSPFFFLFLKR